MYVNREKGVYGKSFSYRYVVKKVKMVFYVRK